METTTFNPGTLVESFPHGFGRVIEILSNDAIVIRFSYSKHEIIYRKTDAEMYLTIHEEA